MLGYKTCATMQALEMNFNGGCSLLTEVLYIYMLESGQSRIECCFYLWPGPELNKILLTNLKQNTYNKIEK